MIFRNRQQAGQILASRLEKYANREDVIVLGVPRGRVPVAFEVAKAYRSTYLCGGSSAYRVIKSWLLGPSEVAGYGLQTQAWWKSWEYRTCKLLR
jgi:hypothetical protein